MNNTQKKLEAGYFFFFEKQTHTHKGREKEVLTQRNTKNSTQKL